MKHELRDLYAELGPLLIFDASSETHLSQAEAGYCVWLKCAEVRQFTGSVELLVEEATPAHVEFAHQQSLNLWLRVPTGKLVVAAGESPRFEFDVPPGDYAVDAWAYEPHEVRLEEAELPGDPPRPKWAGLVEVATWIALLVSIAGAVALVTFFKVSEWSLFGLSLAVIAAAWASVFVVSRATGTSAYQKALNANLARTIAALPLIPDFTVQLRRVDVPPPSGGGVSN